MSEEEFRLNAKDLYSSFVPRREADLVRRAKEGDAEAWATLYDEHFPTLYRYAYARVRDRQDAEDIAAQVFLDALKGIDRYEDRGRPVLAWLYRIAHNVIVERLRRAQRYRRVTSGWPAPGHNPGPEKDIDHIDLLEAVARLTPDQQEVIILRYFLQMTSREVSQVLNKTEAAVFSLQTRGINSLRKILEPGTKGTPARTPPAAR